MVVAFGHGRTCVSVRVCVFYEKNNRQNASSTECGPSCRGRESKFFIYLFLFSWSWLGSAVLAPAESEEVRVTASWHLDSFSSVTSRHCPLAVPGGSLMRLPSGLHHCGFIVMVTLFVTDSAGLSPPSTSARNAHSLHVNIYHSWFRETKYLPRLAKNEEDVPPS